MKKNISLICLVRLYQIYISPLLNSLFGNSCRHYPTCSNFAIISLRFNNTFYSVFQIIFRILSCNPFFEGGVNFPIIYLTQNEIKTYKLKIFLNIPVKCKKLYLTDIKTSTILFIPTKENSKFIHLINYKKFYIIRVYS